MILDKTLLCEAGYVGEELIKDSGISDLDRKCYCVDISVREDIFTLAEALEAYQVTEEQFRKYMGLTSLE